MHRPLMEGPGVSVNLVYKQISILHKQGIYTVSLSDSFFNLSGSIVTKPSPHVVIATGNRQKMKLSKNHGILYRKRITHLGAAIHPRLSSSCKLSWFFSKFRYTGKGLKIKKGASTSTVLFNLGSSHISKIHYNQSQLQILRTKKNTYTVISPNTGNKLQGSDMYTIRPYNIYTRRGVRLNRQSVVRRFGKVSQLAPKKK
jgi:hypothetical protein